MSKDLTISDDGGKTQSRRLSVAFEEEIITQYRKACAQKFSELNIKIENGKPVFVSITEKLKFQ